MQCPLDVIIAICKFDENIREFPFSFDLLYWQNCQPYTLRRVSQLSATLFDFAINVCLSRVSLVIQVFVVLKSNLNKTNKSGKKSYVENPKFS